MLDKSKKTGGSNFSEDEIARFDALAESWWDPKGKYKTALDFNRARLDVIKAQIENHFGKGKLPPDYSTLSMIDIGSGGGLISEPLAKLGAHVTGIDASAVSVEVAKRHAEKSGVDVNYRHMLSSEVVGEGLQYDVVINAEVVEHVPDQRQLIKECASLVKPGGLLILATLNRTFKSYIIAIVGAEYVMRYLPIGTHDWRKFVKPRELQQWVGGAFSLKHQVGMKLNPLKGEWLTTSSLAVNFIQTYSRDE
ncbi:bifunctional 2-polyprenyl-6-hydroxyphenol methylase/3-demethylubiquinol 3-O-methyltransferase UbiG [Alteromonas gracilis]|uniref:Ubiquinone biosynthesis O-methyltransferase n=1 Tax=Alteromonas gracilis TaxID=1479524 RepID=A0ABX5CJL7_9ALTE|nr:bifunctional 2-polyprenyl-6-hydroxyphenol methylase/3-demethylubiquinol 3-O-methyltransferase UbiG [Alteromonas gracilis]PRO67645.1 bifunctional 3-demethylubiquinol 3-O-methyltransferase/2-polyprenyl-6-hydroxyphenol methylase [Alteromonas gracilis]